MNSISLFVFVGLIAIASSTIYNSCDPRWGNLKIFVSTMCEFPEMTVIGTGMSEKGWKCKGQVCTPEVVYRIIKEGKGLYVYSNGLSEEGRSMLRIKLAKYGDQPVNEMAAYFNKPEYFCFLTFKYEFQVYILSYDPLIQEVKYYDNQKGIEITKKIHQIEKISTSNCYKKKGFFSGFEEEIEDLLELIEE